MRESHGGQSSDSERNSFREEIDPFNIPFDYAWVDANEKKCRIKAKKAKSKKHKKQNTTRNSDTERQATDNVEEYQWLRNFVYCSTRRVSSAYFITFIVLNVSMLSSFSQKKKNKEAPGLTHLDADLVSTCRSKKMSKPVMCGMNLQLPILLVKVIKLLRTNSRLRSLVYISCNPETLDVNAIEICTTSPDETGKGNNKTTSYGGR
ncbi:hypothetical protein BC332_13175 [Capsicum chinense]|nr:hypothetical protein BC332_13175 [Capsicum chinense]